MPAVERILQHKIIAVIRLRSYDQAAAVAQALLAGGILVMEFTLTGQGAMAAVAAARQALGHAGCVGVGSVLHPEQAAAAIDAGAQFLVTPAVRRAVIAAGTARRTLVVAGGYTPTELLEAHEAGAGLVKLFPARLGGPAYLRDVLAPLPFLRLVPTGGVDSENARAYLEAGAAAVGIGGSLVSDAVVAAGDFHKIEAAARSCVGGLR
jgi:2-dehydro-3-deoxyphosphogluconate aldolase / (4S)-4-hydroxy-2-oxoglutarate aldolase